ncbi:MAG TPA: bacteriohemerythrin, partial [Thiotrichales bacterium]|nr:bacteriohemerythrin [Thiotrichales bacterium]
AGPTHPLTWGLILFLFSIPFLHRKLTERHYLVWSDDYSVGIDSIDRQHRRLINLINQLQTAIDFAMDREFEREALDELVDYTRTHFSYEEELMREYGYPDFEAHRREHEGMIRKVENLLSSYERDPEGTIQEAHDFLRDWLIHHIQGTDRRYSGFLKEKGVT